MAKYFKSNGSLFINENREGKEPHFQGYVNITQEQLDALQELFDRGVEEPRLQIGAWKRVGQKSGKKYISLAGEVYLKDDAGSNRVVKRKSKPVENDDGWDDDDIPFN